MNRSMCYGHSVCMSVCHTHELFSSYIVGLLSANFDISAIGCQRGAVPFWLPAIVDFILFLLFAVLPMAKQIYYHFYRIAQ